MPDFHKNKQYYAKTDWTVNRVGAEIDGGLALLNKIDDDIVTFFGSARIKSDNPNYIHCKNLASELGRSGYAIMSGGGPGIMHAANTGAKEAEACSIGMRAELLKSEHTNDPIYDYLFDFHFLFVRRFIMSIKSKALIFYPGGLGTLNEIFEYGVLMQTGIVDVVPIICVNKKFWDGLFNQFGKTLVENDFLMHGKDDLSMFHIVDTNAEVLNILKSTKTK